MAEEKWTIELLSKSVHSAMVGACKNGGTVEDIAFEFEDLSGYSLKSELTKLGVQSVETFLGLFPRLFRRKGKIWFFVSDPKSRVCDNIFLSEQENSRKQQRPARELPNGHWNSNNHYRNRRQTNYSNRQTNQSASWYDKPVFVRRLTPNSDNVHVREVVQSPEMNVNKAQFVDWRLKNDNADVQRSRSFKLGFAKSVLQKPASGRADVLRFMPLKPKLEESTSVDQGSANDIVNVRRVQSTKLRFGKSEIVSEGAAKDSVNVRRAHSSDSMFGKPRIVFQEAASDTVDIRKVVSLKPKLGEFKSVFRGPANDSAEVRRVQSTKLRFGKTGIVGHGTATDSDDVRKVLPLKPKLETTKSVDQNPATDSADRRVQTFKLKVERPRLVGQKVANDRVNVRSVLPLKPKFEKTKSVGQGPATDLVTASISSGLQQPNENQKNQQSKRSVRALFSSSKHIWEDWKPLETIPKEVSQEEDNFLHEMENGDLLCGDCVILQKLDHFLKQQNDRSLSEVAENMNIPGKTTADLCIKLTLLIIEKGKGKFRIYETGNGYKVSQI